MIIGLSGKKRVGKDTVAAMLELLLPNSKTYAFAARLKAEVARACGVTVPYIDEHKDNFRLILQGWGTDFKRKLHGEDYWIKKMQIALTNLNTDCVIVPDVRFKNESQFIKNNHGIIIRVERETGHLDKHISETELDSEPYDHLIVNNGTLEELLTKVENVVKQIKKHHGNTYTCRL